jgi:hypothetical protein
MKFLVWLHLDPPEDGEVRKRVCELLLGKMKSDAFSLWEELIYPGSANAPEIKACRRKKPWMTPHYQWNDEEKKRLRRWLRGVACPNRLEWGCVLLIHF